MSEVSGVKEHTNVARRVADVLVDQIATGRWTPGDRLPSEHELATLLSVSRLTVREGMRRVQALGFVRVEHGRGVFVLEPQVTQLLPSHALSRIFASPERTREVHEARLVLELGLTELAVTRASPTDLEALKETLRKARAVLGEDGGPTRERKLIEIGLEFHLRLAAAAHSPLLASLYELLVEPLVRSVERPHELRGDPREDLSFHVAVLEAIEQKDVAAAVGAMSTHIRRTSAIVLGDL